MILRLRHLYSSQAELEKLGVGTASLPRNKLQAVLEAVRPILAKE